MLVRFIHRGPTENRKMNTDKQIEVLKNTIRSMKNRLDYNAHWMAFMAGTVSEAQFVADAERFCVRQRPIDDVQDDIRTLLSVPGLPLSPRDVAELFNVSPDEALESVVS